MGLIDMKILLSADSIRLSGEVSPGQYFTMLAGGTNLFEIPLRLLETPTALQNLASLSYVDHSRRYRVIGTRGPLWVGDG